MAPLYVILCICIIYIILNYRKSKEHYKNINDNLYFINSKESTIESNIIGYKRSKGEILNEVYTEILQRVSNIFKKLDIKFFLTSGTLLGYFREGRFIEYDYDIDIGIFKEDFSNDIIKEFKKNGFIYYRLLGNYKDGLELSFYYPGTKLGKRAKVDIFLHYRENDNKHIFWTSYWGNPKKRIKYRVSNFNIKKTKFMGIDCWVPYPTLKYIEEHYGKNDWMIPKRPGKCGEYHFSYSPTSIVKN